MTIALNCRGVGATWWTGVMTSQPPTAYEPTAPMNVPRFFIKQKITVMVNRYEVLAANPDGTPGALMAFAQQKRMTMKEEVVFFSDESRSRRVFSFKARQMLDVRAEQDVFDEGGQRLGGFKKEFGASLLRSTWRLDCNGIQAVGQERRLSIALLRRFWNLIPYIGDVWVPFVFHFDFVDQPSGQTIMVSERQRAIRDRYDVTVADPRLDFRVAASMAVALDALQSR